MHNKHYCIHLYHTRWCRVSFFPARTSQQLVKTRISTPAALIHIVQIKIFLLAEGASSAEGELVARLISVVVAVLDGGVGVCLVLKGDEAVVAAPLSKMEADVEDGSEELEALPQVGLQRPLRNAAHVDDAPFLDLLLRLGGRALPNAGVTATGGPTSVKVIGVVDVVVAGGSSLLTPAVRRAVSLRHAPSPVRPDNSG